MQNAPLIPDDLAACQDLLRDSLARLDAAEAQCQQAYATGESLHSKLLDVMQERDRLKETIERLLHQLYGRRSERHPDLADVDYGELPAQDPPPPPPDPVPGAAFDPAPVLDPAPPMLDPPVPGPVPLLGLL